MIRWTYVVTRLLIVTAVLLLLGFGLGPVARFATIKGLESTIGAKVEIGNTSVGLFPPCVRYDSFSIADPRDGKEYRDAFRAESIELEIDGNEMLRRRWVVRNGSIKGLQIGSNRETSGQFQETDEDYEAPSLSDKPSVLTNLLHSMADQVSSQTKDALNDLETVKQSKAIKDRWQREYERLAQRAKLLESNVKQSTDNAKAIDNPLRDFGKIEETVRLVEQSKSELQAILTAIDSVPARFEADLASLERAKASDINRIDQYVPGDLSQSSHFGVDLINAAVQEQIETLRDYLESGRDLAGYTIVAPEASRTRGQDIDLSGGKSYPDLLVRRCKIQGLMRADGEVYSVAGIVENLTSTPQFLDDPMTAQLQLHGPQTINVVFLRDRRGNNQIDQLKLHWPQSDAPELNLGDDGLAKIALTGGQREIIVQLRAEGRHIEGQLVSRQTGVNVDLQVDSSYDDLPATGALQNGLASVDTIVVDATFKGTWDDLSMKINTNLDGILKDATQSAIRSQLAASKQKLSKEIDQRFEEEKQQLLSWFNEHQLAAQSLTVKADDLLKTLGEKLLDGVDSSDVTIGRLNNLLNGRFR